jgi:hypothetical protein
MSASQINHGNSNTPNPRVSSTRPVTATALSQTNQHVSTNVGPGPASSPDNRLQEGRSILGRVRDFFASRPIGHSLLHGFGLKTFSFKKKYEENGKEISKPVVVRSFLVALASLDTHLLPALITIFLIGTNAQVFVNGPPITTWPQYALQGAAKLHELTIVASLARVITDILRYQLLDEGVNFGMLGSPFTFFGLNYLWSQEFFSAVQSAWEKPRLKAHSFLVCVLVLFCILAAVVGPASALLFLPSPAWLSAGSTDFFLIGTENDLWPQNLTRQHAGGPSCLTTDGGNFWCLQGGWDIIQGFVTPEGVSKREVQILDGATARTMWLCRPYVRGDSDSWASTLHGASVYLAERVTQFHQVAWSFAKGRQRRLRDATVSGTYNRFIGRIPVVRVVCSPFGPVNRTSPTLFFPVIEPNKPWRLGDKPGTTKKLALTGTYKSLVNATLFSLPQGLGTSTVGVAFVTNNATFAAGCGCAVDMRWAQGRSTPHGASNYWQAFVGDPVLPAALNFETHQDISFSDPEMQKYLGATLTADEDWIRALNTGYQLKDSTGNFTALEVILVSTRLWDMPWVLNDKVAPTRDLE